MFNRIYKGPESSDCTAPYDVTLDKEYTVREFIQTVLENYPKEFGMITIENGHARSPHLEYKYGEIVQGLPQEYLDKKIDWVFSASGGYSWMSYRLVLAD